MTFNAADVFFSAYLPILIINFLVIIICLLAPSLRGLKMICLSLLMLTGGYLILTLSLFPECGMAGPILLAGFVTIGAEFIALLAIYLKRLRPPPPSG